MAKKIRNWATELDKSPLDHKPIAYDSKALIGIAYV